MNYSENDHVTIVSEIDGTIIEDEDYFRTLPALHRFILLRDTEKWKQGLGRGIVPKYYLLFLMYL